MARLFSKNKTEHTAKDNVFAALLLFGSFLALALFVYIATESYKTFHIVSLIFTFFWSVLFCAVILVLPRRAGRIVYAVWYLFLLIYGTAQYIYFQIFNKLFSFTVISNLNEGAGYLGSSLSYLGPWQVVFFLVLLLLGAYVFFTLPSIDVLPKRMRFACIPLALGVVILSQFTLPRAYGEKTDYAVWNFFEDARYVYENYTNPHKCMGMAGYYQYLNIDFYNCFLKPFFIDTMEQSEQIEAFFASYDSTHKENEYTGMFEGKNAIIVMMESMDYLAISEENTPTIHMMMQNGINFPNYYASIFGDGATFSNEFVMNTGIYAPSNGAAPYFYISNTFSESLPNLFLDKGYTVNSFHENYGWFYNRALMHQAFGYQRYHSFYDYGGEHDDVIVDTFLTRTPSLMDRLLCRDNDSDTPFMSFVITYSAHLAYTYDGELAEYAFENYVDYGEELGGSEDLDVLMAKARITDQMLGELLDQIDENTIVICAADHYAYGLNEETLLEKKGDNWALRQNTPFFIYCKDPTYEPFEVDKICSNADFLPTIANLFGLDLSDRMLGHDIFDPDYEGFVIFSNYAWLTKDVFWHDQNIIEYSDDYPEDLIASMTEYTFRRIKINDYLLTSDYYKNR